MSRRPWWDVIPLEDEALYQAAGFGHPAGCGKRPALLVIDVQYRTVGRERRSILESIRTEYPTSCGNEGWRAVPHIARLLESFRSRGLPVLFPHVAPKTINDGGRFAEKAPSVMGVPLHGYDFVEEVAPRPGDILIPKHHASAFFGTPLVSHLVDRGVDTVFLSGCTTSGCVRATAIDASSYGFRVVVPQECVFDRSKVSHAVNLFDIANKYGDVLTVTQALDAISACADKH